MGSEPVGARPLYLAWLLVAAVCTALMWTVPGDETIPYHVAWATFALAYGLVPWSTARTIAGLSAFTLLTGGVLLLRAMTGVIAWQETAEIPLMTLLMILLVWHVRRRQMMLAAVTVMARREREQAQEREQLTRLTSHEMRTPLTIARGYVELLAAREVEPERRHDLAVVDDELERLTRVCERLVRAIRLQGAPELDTVDVDAMLQQTARRWATVADRGWVVEAAAGTFSGSAERLRASLDTLIENALRYTGDGDTVRLFARRRLGQVDIGVADSGTGMSEQQLQLVNDPDRQAADHEDVPRDELSQTGLGLGLVRSVVSARGGRLLATWSPEGGAEVTMRFPVAAAAEVLPGDQELLEGSPV